MGRTFKLLFTLIIFNFLFFSFSFSFKIISHDLKYTFYKRDRLVWSFVIREFIQEENGDFKGKGIYIINKEKGLEIWADKGFYKKDEDKFLLKNNVHLVTSEYGEVITQELVFYPKKNLIFTDKEVFLIKKNMRIKGVGFIYDVETGNFKVKEKAKVKIKL